jgi:hypothetical protein
MQEEILQRIMDVHWVAGEAIEMKVSRQASVLSKDQNVIYDKNRMLNSIQTHCHCTVDYIYK